MKVSTSSKSRFRQYDLMSPDIGLGSFYAYRMGRRHLSYKFFSSNSYDIVARESLPFRRLRVAHPVSRVPHKLLRNVQLNSHLKSSLPLLKRHS